MNWLIRKIKSWFVKEKGIEIKPVSKPITDEDVLDIVDNLKNKEVLKKEVEKKENGFKLSEKGIDLIVEFEGFYSKPYLCSAKVPTIGVGTIKYPNGLPVKLSDPNCTREQANEWLLDELTKKEKVLNDFLELHKVELKQHQYDALMSFAYNLGTGYFKPGTSIGNAIIVKSDSQIASAIMNYDKVCSRSIFGKRCKSIRGLTRRRDAERSMFLGVNRTYKL